MTHDKLQSIVFTWAWNNYPTIRPLFFAALNEVPRLPYETAHNHMTRVMRAKSIGLVKGIYDLLWFHKSCLICFDIKLPGDKVSKEQADFKQAIEANNGNCYEISTLEEFQSIFKNIYNAER